MNTKIAAGSRDFAKVADGETNTLVQQLEARTREYLNYCAKTIPSEERHTIWSRLYAAAHRLRNAVVTGGGNYAAVADAVLEIGSNLLGCEEIAVLRLDSNSKFVYMVSSVGITPAHRRALKTHTEEISAEINRGQVRIVDKRVPGDEFLASIGITALVPLSQGHTLEGAIVFFSLLPQRTGFDSGDRELLGLLSIYVRPSDFAT
ncbi:MAG: hypothetical protein WB460_04150 [Candidatus Acidiferrales bacterium]